MAVRISDRSWPRAVIRAHLALRPSVAEKWALIRWLDGSRRNAASGLNQWRKRFLARRAEPGWPRWRLALRFGLHQVVADQPVAIVGAAIAILFLLGAALGSAIR